MLYPLSYEGGPDHNVRSNHPKRRASGAGLYSGGHAPLLPIVGFIEEGLRFRASSPRSDLSVIVPAYDAEPFIERTTLLPRV